MGKDLFAVMAAYGADMAGIQDRFMGDIPLYALCLREFLDEPNFDLLKRAIDAADWEAAFKAAHAIKGLSGNMGLTPFYETICALVETLRAGHGETAAKEYKDVEAARRYVAWIAEDALKSV